MSYVHRRLDDVEAYLCQGLVTRHKVFVGGDLSEKTLGDYVVVRIVASIIPVVDHLVEHCTRFPPIVGLWQQANRLACKVAFVVRHHTIGDGGCGILNGFWTSARISIYSREAARGVTRPDIRVLPRSSSMADAT